MFHSAVDQGVDVARDLVAASAYVDAIRGFVLRLDSPVGSLAGTRAGWRRDPARPPYVSEYASEQLFVLADPCRAAVPKPGIPGGLSVVAGEMFGVGWRRDGDDDDPLSDEPALLGPWQLGYIPTTGEVYAVRRCHYRDPRVWLLARGHTQPDRTRHLLTVLKNRMGEPNSVLLAARIAQATAESTTSDTNDQANSEGDGDA